MSEEMHTPSEREDVEMLVPWYVTGRLDAADAGRVEAYMRGNPEFARSVELAREERAAAVSVSEAQGMPSARATDELFARIAAEPQPAVHQAKRRASGLLAALSEFFTAPSPVAVRYAAVAAAALVLVQAAALGHLLSSSGREDFRTASGPQTAADGTFALVGFAPEARLGDVAALLEGLDARIVEGPLKGGLYRVRIAADAARARATLDALKANRGLVRAVLPSR